VTNGPLDSETNIVILHSHASDDRFTLYRNEVGFKNLTV